MARRLPDEHRFTYTLIILALMLVMAAMLAGCETLTEILSIGTSPETAAMIHELLNLFDVIKTGNQALPDPTPHGDGLAALQATRTAHAVYLIDCLVELSPQVDVDRWRATLVQLTE